MKIRILAFVFLALSAVLILSGLFSPDTSRAPAGPLPVPTEQLLDGFDPSSALNALDDAVKKNGGDLDTHTVRLAVGFATGAFGRDPVAQRAMSDVGEQFLDRLLRPGDRVSLFGFEKQPGPAIWDQSFDTGRADPIAATWGQLKPGVGGIDYDEAILSTLGPLQPAVHNNIVIVLIAPWGANEEATNEIGTPNFASLPPQVLAQAHLSRSRSISIHYRQKQGNLQRTVYVTFLTSIPFRGNPLARSRADTMPQDGNTPIRLADAPAQDSDVPTPAEDAAPRRASPDPRLFIPGLISLAAGLVLLWRSPTAKSLTLTVLRPNPGGELQFTGPWSEGEVLCRIVGSGVAPEGTITDLTLPGLPPAVYAQIKRTGPGITVLSDHALEDIHGQRSSQAGYLVRPRQPCRLSITGRQASQTGVQTAEIEMEVKLQ